MALASVPGDLNIPAYAASGWSVVGFVLEPLYLPAAAALVLRYPTARLTRAHRWLVLALTVASVGTRIPVVTTSGDLPDGVHQDPGRAGAYLPFLHDWVLVRGGRTVVIILLLTLAVMLARRVVSAIGPAGSPSRPSPLSGRCARCPRPRTRSCGRRVAGPALAACGDGARPVRHPDPGLAAGRPATAP